MKKNCLIIDDLHPSILEMMEGIGYEVDYQPNITREELLQQIGPFSGMLVRSKTLIDAEVLDCATNLKFIGRAGAGLDQIDVEEVQKRGITLFNAPEGNQDAVGEHAIGMLLNLLNKMRVADDQIRNFEWNREANRGYELSSQTVGIIGYGHMGKAFARRLSGFGCKILAYDKYKTGFGNDFVEEVSLEQLKERTTVLSLHTPLTEETSRWVNGEFLRSFKSLKWFLNTARGGIVPLADLCELLELGILKGAALDVLENEKFDKIDASKGSDFERLISLPNVILTPHVAGWSYESHVKINQALVDKIGGFEG